MSLPWIPMSIAQLVIPVSSALIVVAEVLHRRPRRRARASRALGGLSLADGTH